MTEFSKGGTMFNIYQRAFNFHKKYFNTSTEEGWAALAEELARSFQTEFELALVMPAIADIEHRARAMAATSKGKDINHDSSKPLPLHR